MDKTISPIQQTTTTSYKLFETIQIPAPLTKIDVSATDLHDTTIYSTEFLIIHANEESAVSIKGAPVVSGMLLTVNCNVKQFDSIPGQGYCGVSLRIPAEIVRTLVNNGLKDNSCDTTITGYSANNNAYNIEHVTSDYKLIELDDTCCTLNCKLQEPQTKFNSITKIEFYFNLKYLGR